MKKFLLFLVFALSTLTLASARDVGDRVNADVGTAVQMDQPQYCIPAMDVVTIEIAPVVLFSKTYVATLKQPTPLLFTNQLLWIDPGICKQVSVNNCGTYFIQLNQLKNKSPQFKYTQPVVTTTRHVLFSFS